MEEWFQYNTLDGITGYTNIIDIIQIMWLYVHLLSNKEVMNQLYSVSDAGNGHWKTVERVH